MTAPNIPKTQQAAIVEKLGPGATVQIKEIPVPDPASLQPSQCLIKLECSGVCHSDLSIRNHEYGICAYAQIPLVGGHEGVGKIVALAQNPSTTTFSVGQRVGVKWLATTCLSCEECMKGNEQLCANTKFSGLTTPGTFQQYVVGHLGAIVPIPEQISFEMAAPILCAGVTVFKALKESNTRAGDWVALPGAGGGLGHLGVQYAKAMGLRVVAIDTGAEKKELCTSLGADAWVDFKEVPDLVKAVIAATDGKGPKAAIVTAAVGPPYVQALSYLAREGTLVAVGLPPTLKLEVDIFAFVGKMQRIQASYVGTRQDTVEALRLVATGQVKPHVVVKPLNQLAEIYDVMEKGQLTGRVVLDLK